MAKRANGLGSIFRVNSVSGPCASTITRHLRTTSRLLGIDVKTRRVSTALTSVILGLLMSLGAAPAMAMNVYVNVMMDNTTIVIDVEPSDTIEAVKTKIEDKTGYTPEQQVLEINGIFLDDGTILSDYGIQAGATIDMLPITGLPPRSGSSTTDSLPQTGLALDALLIPALAISGSGLALLAVAASRRRTNQL